VTKIPAKEILIERQSTTETPAALERSTYRGHLGSRGSIRELASRA